MKPVIVVVGATGRQGGSVVDALMKNGQWTVRGLTRNVNSATSQDLVKRGVEVVSCNIDSVEDCERAFQGAHGIFAMTNYWECGPEKEYEQGINMVKAAHAQGVQHFIWSSLPDTVAISNGELNLSHYMTKARVESYIRSQQDSPLFPYTTFIYIGFYYQNFQTFFQPNDQLEFRVPLAPDARLPLYDVQDTGPIVALCFADPKRWGQGNIVPTVSERLTMEEICQTIRRVTGNERVRYVPLTPEECQGHTQEFLDNMRWYSDYGEYEQRHAEKTKEIYDQMKTLEQWLRESKWLADKS